MRRPSTQGRTVIICSQDRCWTCGFTSDLVESDIWCKMKNLLCGRTLGKKDSAGTLCVPTQVAKGSGLEAQPQWTSKVSLYLFSVPQCHGFLLKDRAQPTMGSAV